MTQALILIDYINEIAHKKGKLSSKGYHEFILNNNTFKHINSVIQKAREKNMLIIHVKVGFSNSYIEQPKSSPIFAKAHEFKALQLNSWATEFHEELHIEKEDIIITKHRVSAFHQTPLQLILQNNNIKSIYVAGVATDLAVSSTIRQAHDLDYTTYVLSNCCADSSMDEHKRALQSIEKFATVIDEENF